MQKKLCIFTEQTKTYIAMTLIEYFTNNMWQLWLTISIVCLILEVTSGDFFILCFSIGALGGIIASLCSDSITAQIIAFAVISVLCLLFVRPALVKRLHHSGDERLSNADAMVGQTGVVSQSIEAGGFGRVAIDGDDWKAQSATGEAIDKGTRVKVTRLDSIIITVEPTTAE